MSILMLISYSFLNDTAPTEIYTLSLHDALPISRKIVSDDFTKNRKQGAVTTRSKRRRSYRLVKNATAGPRSLSDRKSTRLNSSHQIISYAVFCLKKKKSQYHQLYRLSRN